jgi:tetratricopeptide (TPR) repeat protein
VFLVRPLAILFAALFIPSSRAESFAELSSRAAAAREANRLPEAVRLYRQALELNPKWQEGWWFLGTILYDTNEYGGCRDALGRLVQLKADAAPAWGMLGLCEFQTHGYAHALEGIQRGLKLGSEITPEMERVLKYHEAILLTHAGDYDHAIQKYAWFVRSAGPGNAFLVALGLAALRTPLLPQDVPSGQQDLFAAAGKAAFAQMAGDSDGSRREFESLLERYPTAHHVHYLYACSLLANHPDQAIREFRRELENTPESSGTLNMLAWALLNSHEPSAALPYAEKAAKIEPASPLAQYVLGRSLVETGAVERGIRFLEQAEQNDPASLENHLALAAAYPKARRYRDARREREKCLEMTRAAGSVAQR